MVLSESNTGGLGLEITNEANTVGNTIYFVGAETLTDNSAGLNQIQRQNISGSRRPGWITPLHMAADTGFYFAPTTWVGNLTLTQSADRVFNLLAAGSSADQTLNINNSVDGYELHLVTDGHITSGQQMIVGTRLRTGVVTLPASDTTPDVSGGNLFYTDGTGQTITDFDLGAESQVITVISTDATVFDTTSALDSTHRLRGSSVNITTASGDITHWVCTSHGGTDVWYLVDFNDASADNS